MKNVIVIGAGPAGLTAAYELLNNSKDYKVTVLEESDCFGGISRTVNYKGNRMDMGGHRFFSKMERVNAFWEELLPLQGAPSSDDIILNREMPIKSGGPNPESVDEVMLWRRRVSRILFDSKFYDYPISLKPETFKNMGIGTTFLVGCSYLKSMIKKLPEDNLENFYINRFGKKLYSMFFEYYTENLWGRHPSQIDASWGAQRVKGLSITAILKDVFGKVFKKNNRKVETSLIEEFKYPKLGPGQLWDQVAKHVTKMGGVIIKNACVNKLHRESEGANITGITYIKDNEEIRLDADIVISSMPLKDLGMALEYILEEPLRVAKGLPYRDYMTLGVLVSDMALINKSKFKTIGDIVPDCWVYVQDRNVRMGRFQIYNNWSPYMVKEPKDTVWIGLEYFVNEGDEYWNMSEDVFAGFAIKEMVSLGIISSKDKVIDYHMEKVKKAYPAYFDTYDEIEILTDYIKGIGNLYCVGRNGQHRYNNLDHSMATSFEAVDNILSGRKDKDNIWSVNTEQEYHESGEKQDS